MNPSVTAQTALLNTLQEIQDRAEVEECIRDMLIDVEIAVTLEERLKARHQIQLLQRRLQEQEEVVAESRALRNDSAQKQVAMADALLQELLTLSKELGELKEIKRQHEELLVQYDEVVAKLMQAEEIEKECKSEPPKEDVKVDSNIGEAPALVKEEATATVNGEDPASTVMTAVEVAQLTAIKDEPTKPEFASTEESSSIFRTSEESNRVAPELLATESIDDPAAVTLDEESESDTPRFDEFDTEVLMKIFAYLDALDILNTAQINICMYSRVDSLFGIGGGGHGHDVSEPPPPQQEDSSTIATNETPSYSATVHQQPTIASVPAAATITTTTAVVASAASTSGIAPSAAIQPTVVTVIPPAAPASKPTATVTANIKSPTYAGIASNSADAAVNRGIFSLLQPRRLVGAVAPLSSASSSSNTPPRNSPRSRAANPPPSPPSSSSDPAVVGGALPMNAAMANSMAAKLSDAELNAIILMTEHLKQKESLAARLMKEKDELVAKLDGTEGVKQFLIAKVRDMEASLSSSVENETRVAQQIASDQEVIAFLDGRVQELERENLALRNEKQTALNELERVQRQSNQKATVMGDMLQFEREKLADNEREWKATKKLLVKEVKHCRAQIVALQAERDGYREQNDTLRRAVVNIIPNGSMHSQDRAFAKSVTN